MSQLTLTEQRIFARTQRAVTDALAQGDPEKVRDAQDQLELLRQELFERDDE